MLFLTQSAAVYGIDALIVDAEVNITPTSGDDALIIIVGLPDTAVRESRERIRAAISNSGYFFPIHKVTINLAPADVKKEGASFDLPIALGILGANGDLGTAESLPEMMSTGSLKPSEARKRSSSTPSMPGMPRSRATIRGRSCLNRSRNCWS